MIQDIIKSLGERMHDQCEYYVGGNQDPSIVADVKGMLETLDGLKRFLAQDTLDFHRAIMDSVDRPPQEFIENTYSLCCSYTI